MYVLSGLSPTLRYMYVHVLSTYRHATRCCHPYCTFFHPHFPLPLHSFDLPIPYPSLSLRYLSLFLTPLCPSACCLVQSSVEAVLNSGNQSAMVDLLNVLLLRRYSIPSSLYCNTSRLSSAMLHNYNIHVHIHHHRHLTS